MILLIPNLRWKPLILISTITIDIKIITADPSIWKKFEPLALTTITAYNNYPQRMKKKLKKLDKCVPIFETDGCRKATTK